jgi:hypothetical protein
MGALRQGIGRRNRLQTAIQQLNSASGNSVFDDLLSSFRLVNLNAKIKKVIERPATVMQKQLTVPVFEVNLDPIVKWIKKGRTQYRRFASPYRQ